MLEIPLKFKTEHLSNNGFPIIEIVGTIDIGALQRCEERAFTAEARNLMEKSMAQHIDGELFSELRHAIYTARYDVLRSPYSDYNLVNEIFSRIESAIPKITP